MATTPSRMTWPEAREYARAGVPVRREAWALTKSLVYVKGAGTTRAVAVIVTSTTTSVVKSADFGELEFKAPDWRVA